MMPSPDDHPASLKLFFPFLKGVAFLIFGFFGAPVRAKDRKNVPMSGSLLVISNHLSNCDPVVVQYASPRLLHFLARKELFDMLFVRRIARWFRAVPIKQSSPDKGALKKAIELLRDGKAVGIFPEGQLSDTGKLLELFEGTALIVRKTGAPCICVGIKDSNKFMPNPKATPQWSFTAIKVRWGQVRQFDAEASTEEIMGWIESELKRLTDQA